MIIMNCKEEARKTGVKWLGVGSHTTCQPTSSYIPTIPRTHATRSQQKRIE